MWVVDESPLSGIAGYIGVRLILGSGVQGLGWTLSCKDVVEAQRGSGAAVGGELVSCGFDRKSQTGATAGGEFGSMSPL